MRLRCPAKNCPIDVPDELVGVRIRCPHCGAWLVVDNQYRDPSAEQIQAGAPSVTSVPVTPVKLENQIYDGLPPLSLMIALRRQKGSQYDLDDFGSNYAMTDDDWKALSAFESVLLAVVSLRITLVVGAAAMAVNLLAWFVSVEPNPRDHSINLGWLLGRGVMLFALAWCYFIIYSGAQALRRIRIYELAKLLPWCALFVALIVGTNAAINVQAIFDERTRESLSFVVWVSIPFNVLAAFDSGKSAWHVGQSLDQVNPPEISNRLVAALRYLE